MATEKLPMLQEGYDKQRRELQLLREERPRIVDAIEEARLAKIAADVPVVAEGLESLDKSDWLPEGLGETEGAK